ncbi:hypothetical protein ACFX1Q_040727 [Malus domestica]
MNEGEIVSSELFVYILYTIFAQQLARKEETARVGSCEKSIKPASKEATEICVLLKLDLLEDIDACAKFVDGNRYVVCPSSFVKHMTQYRRTALLAMMHI